MLNYIQLESERNDLENDQSDITKMIKTQFQMIIENGSELFHEQLWSIPISCVFLIDRFNNALYGYGDNE